MKVKDFFGNPAMVVFECLLMAAGTVGVFVYSIKTGDIKSAVCMVLVALGFVGFVLGRKK